MAKTLPDKPQINSNGKTHTLQAFIFPTLYSKTYFTAPAYSVLAM